MEGFPSPGISQHDWDGGRFECCKSNDAMHGCETCCQRSAVACAATLHRSKIMPFNTACSYLVALNAVAVIFYIVFGTVVPAITWLPYLVLAVIVACFGYRYRMQMAAKYGLPVQDSASEFICWCCCQPCTICQEYRTIKLNVGPDGEWRGDIEAEAPLTGVVIASEAPGKAV